MPQNRFVRPINQTHTFWVDAPPSVTVILAHLEALHTAAEFYYMQQRNNMLGRNDLGETLREMAQLLELRRQAPRRQAPPPAPYDPITEPPPIPPPPQHPQPQQQPPPTEEQRVAIDRAQYRVVSDWLYAEGQGPDATMRATQRNIAQRRADALANQHAQQLQQRIGSPPPRPRNWHPGDSGPDPVLARFPDLQEEEPEDL
jgi:hypothetical protein